MHSMWKWATVVYVHKLQPRLNGHTTTLLRMRFKAAPLVHMDACRLTSEFESSKNEWAKPRTCHERRMCTCVQTPHMITHIVTHAHARTHAPTCARAHARTHEDGEDEQERGNVRHDLCGAMPVLGHAGVGPCLGEAMHACACVHEGVHA